MSILIIFGCIFVCVLDGNLVMALLLAIAVFVE